MYKLEYLQSAKEDIEDIIYYISHILKNKTAASNLINDIIDNANNILTFPYGNAEFTPIKPLKNKYYRSKVNNFHIFYTINENTKTIVIVRVLYRKRDINKILT